MAIKAKTNPKQQQRWVVLLSALLAIGTFTVALAQSSNNQNTGLAPLPESMLELGNDNEAQPTPAVKKNTPAPAPAIAPIKESSGLAPLESDLYQVLSNSNSAFDLRSGETLRTALTRWCEDSGWTLVWRADNDYQIDINLNFPTGTKINKALRDTMRAVWIQHPEIKATVYRNNVIVIERIQQ